jgi:transcription-repair coupling factor (superfamily II helicase)
MKFKTVKIYRGEKKSIEGVAADLADFGYSRVKQLLSEGEFRVKGDVLDVYPCGWEYPVRIEWEFDDVVSIRGFDLETIVFIDRHEVIVVPPFVKHKDKATITVDDLLDLSVDIKEGDHVVHIDYGIGIFRGRKRFETPKGVRDFLELEYQGGEKIAVALDDIDLLQKYVSFSERGPKLTKLGGKEWINTKVKVQQSLRKFAFDLVSQEARRTLVGGYAMSDDTWMADFISGFPYVDTPDQERAWSEVKADLERPVPMDRLLCGDVGYGKTEVAMRAAFKAAVNRKQVAILVPTTILAEQHFVNLRKRLANFPVTVELLSRFRSPKEQKDVIDRLKKGHVDIVVGTHRVLSKDLGFADLGLLIVDEEQRFGVRQKQRIRSIKSGVHVLTLTATPIPRTLYMSLSGIREISMIRTPPKDRMAVKTFARPFDRKVMKDAIEAELLRGGQVFIVESWIKNIPRVTKILHEQFGDRLKVAIAHGKTPVDELERIMMGFANGEFSCLISTAIIESGIDIPMANTLIVNSAHLFGLADLHQLRGRVGRLDRQAYAYFLYPQGEILGQDAVKRLEYIEDYANLGAGFDIAMRDLELRGAGNIIGPEQHGFIFQIGLDLYCRLLRAEIERQKTLPKTDNGTQSEEKGSSI